MRYDPIFLVAFMLLVLVLVSPNSGAVTDRDLQANPQTYGNTIVFPKQEFFPQNNQLISLRFLLFDNGNAALDRYSICNISIYNITGQPIVDNKLLTVIGAEQTYTLPASVSSVPGVYPYTVRCSPEQAGNYSYLSTIFTIGQGSKTQTDLPLSITLCLIGVFFFSLFFASYFAVQKHPLVYLFTLLAFFIADVLIWLNWRILSFNNSPLVGVFLGLFIGLCAITFVMSIVTMLDVTRMVMQSIKKKEAAANIARFGYA
jgi:hypothetical protein